jgi:enoyl-CoA hydratase/carnithine racemase
MLEAFPYPTVAGIRGHCVTGGLELALACDLLVCAEDARFGDTHARWGLVPTWGLTVRLPERVGHARAKELSFTGRIIDGRTAADIGLVDRCVPTDELEAAMASLTGQILANSRESTRISKALYRHRGTTERKAALEFERALPFGLPRDMAERLSW